ncbi:hypothetical protein C2S53_003141 [Perilla frutescens var. hirtella]|uniref:CCHC-type domain-containing protein n=1 Tax=Perilla frutescens var. hirtella TaxID=608512 RepID=A0AAD4PD15_PERFH|nr:hypothetical protein C2S53_003141 [Perilla frutescens var. hirtella]
MPGRPRKKRVRAFNEPSGSSNKYSKRGKAQECSICSKTGHNKVRCPNKENQILESITTRPKKLETRRRKNFVGIGCHVDLNSGKTTINPGLASQRVVQEAEQSIPQES